MGQLKELRVFVPASVAEEVSRLKHRMNLEDDDIVREALKSYLKEWRRQELVDSMRIGYEHMGAINLQYSELGLESDLNLLEGYEVGLVSGRG